MAIVQCPECHQDVSSRAVVCPHCGLPLEPEKETEKPSVQSRLSQYRKQIAGAVFAGVIVLAIVAVSVSHANRCSASRCNNTRVPNGEYCSKHTCAKSGCYRYKSENSLYCYDHDSSGSGSTSSYESAFTALQISDVRVTSNSSYTICTGTVKNTGKKTYTFVEVKGSFKDRTGNVLDTDWTYAAGSEGLSPGESTTFRMSVSKNSKITSCSVVLLDYDVQ